MKKKLLSLLLAFAFGAGMSVQASVIASGTCGADAEGANLTWEISDNGVLTISGIGAMQEYTKLGAAPWIVYKNTFTSIVAEEGVTTIGSYAFYQLYDVVSASMPSTLANIGGNAFESCIKLEEVELKSLPNVNASNTFKGCSALTTIWCPCDESLYYVNDFDEGYSYIRLIGYYDKLYRKCDGKHPAYYGIGGADDGNNVTWRFEDGKLILAGSGAMADCFLSPWNLGSAHVTEIEIGDGITVIGANVFLGCKNVKTIGIPATVSAINEDAFFGCDGLTEIICQAQTPPVWGSETTFQGVDRSIPVTVPKSKINDYKAADGWKEFTNYVGSEDEQTPEPCSSEMQGTCGENLNWVITCDGELVISGTGAMADYSIMDDEPKAPWESYKSNFYHKITSVIINSGVTTIGNYALYGCSYVTSISLPEGLTRIGMGGICVCPEIASLTLPSTLAEIERNAFMSCPKLTTLTIPASVERIDAPIFDGYTKMTTLSVETGNKRYDSRNGCNAIIETNTNTLVQGCIATVIPDNITTIGDYAFQYNAFTSVTIPSSVETIASSAFMGCSQLTEITCEAVNPPAIEESWTAFYDVNHDIPVYVPQGSIDAYKKATVWKEFTNIQAIKEPLVTDLTVFGITVNENNYEDILGDGKASYDPATNTLTLKNLVVDFAESAYSNSSIQYSGKNEQFTVEIVGHCELTNINNSFAGFEYSNGELIIKGGELLITGIYNAINAYRVTIDACNLTAIGAYEYTPAIVASEQLKVTNSAHILAINTQDVDYPDGIDWGYPAIATLNTVFDENINILTPGVHFYRTLEPVQWQGTFYTDEANTVFASEVEIGKGTGVVPEDKQTTISFDDPENAETAIFSASANDYYNVEEDRLEISSTLTDEQVASALELLIPGSSAWVEALPGSIVFDVPAGKGEITIECMTLPGYELKLKVAGQVAVSITQTSFGKAKVNYNVTAPTHVVIYLHGGSSPAPARIATNAQDADGAGAYIKNIIITPEGVSTGIDAIKSNADGRTVKLLLNGSLHILTPDGKCFDATGTQLR